MISQKTISTWMEELARVSEKNKGKPINIQGSTTLESMLEFEAQFMMTEPYFVGYMAILIGGLQTPGGTSNSFSHSLLAFGMYLELYRRQEKADKLSKEIG